MSTIKEKRNIVSNFIKNDDLTQLEQYISENNIQLTKLNKSNFDLLVIALEKNVSLNLKKYLLQKYNSLNYYLYSKSVKGYVSPLFLSLYNKDYTFAELLIYNGADINYKIDNKDIIQCLSHYKQLNYIKTLEFLLNKGVNSPSTSLIYELIKNSENSTLKTFIKHFNYNNTYIINFLNYYNYQIPLTSAQLKNSLKNIIIFEDNMYEQAILNNNFEVLKLLIHYDNKDQSHILMKIFRILDSNAVIKEKLFINDLNNQQSLNMLFNQNFIENIKTIEEKRIIVENLVKEEKCYQLNQFIKDNEFYLSYYNNMEMEKDILLYAIEQHVSYKMIDFIISHCYYETLNYTIGHSRCPLLEVLSQERYDVADLLIRNGADINYKVVFNDRIFYYLYFRCVNSRQLSYCIRHGVTITDDVFDLIPKLIQNSQTKLMDVVFRNINFNKDFILCLLIIYKNKRTLSFKQLQDILYKEKYKLYIRKNWYEIAIQKKNYQALRILCNYDYKKNYKAHKVLFKHI